MDSVEILNPSLCRARRCLYVQALEAMVFGISTTRCRAFRKMTFRLGCDTHRRIHAATHLEISLPFLEGGAEMVFGFQR